MRKWAIMGLALAVCSSVSAAEGWMTDFEKAKAKAEKMDRHLLVDFSGSDWCTWCIKLDNEVFKKEAFKEYATEHLVLMLVDFPSDKSAQSAELRAKNKALREKYDVSGYPTILILEPNGELVDRTGYKRGGAEAYVEHIKNLILEHRHEEEEEDHSEMM